MQIYLHLLIVITGLVGFAAQILLLRELLIVFSGNEFSIGVILANWLLLEALGSFYLGKTADKDKRYVQTFIVLTLTFCVFFPLTVYITRILKVLVGVSVGEGLGIGYVFVSSFLILSPISITHGALFTYSCKLYSLISKNDIDSVSKVYIFETIGTLLGSFVVSYLIIPYLHTFKAVFLLTSLNILICFIFFAKHKEILLTKNTLLFSCFSFFVLFIIFLFLFADKLHWLSIKTLWRKQNVVEYQNSKYNNICVTEYEGQYTFFINGEPEIITPVPDIMFVEEFVHIALLSSKNPQSVLVISGGAGGVINEILKHKTVKSIDYVELDPLVLKLMKKFPTELTNRELHDKRVFIRYLDGRRYIKMTQNIYDVVFIGLSDPKELQTNRFFSKEFFKLLKTKLSCYGMVVLTLTGSLTYLNEELVSLNSCLYYTLKEVFSYVWVLPGDGKNIFIASDDNTQLFINSQDLTAKVKQRNLNTTLLLPRHIEYKLHPRWQEWFFRYIEKTKKEINSDLKPKAVFYSLSYWSALFSPYMNKFFKLLKNIDTKKIIFLIIILWGVSVIILKDKLRNFLPAVCVGTSGFAGMVFDLVIIASFQAIYGYVFFWIGILTGFFMVGATAGALISTRILESFDEKLKQRLFIVIEFLVLLFCILLPVIIVILKPYFELPKMYEWLKYVFILLSLKSGLLVGSEFPVANSLQIRITGGLSKTVGLLYSSDLIGGWFGGVFAGLMFLPVIGIV
ncbi:MAG: spermine synthase, partial [Elusimicrobiota bacterium]|nr:spermine synthase [Elusimicrobiota bacterium]